MQDGGSAKEKHLNYPIGFPHEDQVQDGSRVTDQPIYLSPHEGGEDRGSNTEKHSDYYTELHHADQVQDGSHITDKYINYYPREDQVQEMQEKNTYMSQFQFLYWNKKHEIFCKCRQGPVSLTTSKGTIKMHLNEYFTEACFWSHIGGVMNLAVEMRRQNQGHISVTTNLQQMHSYKRNAMNETRD